jgi:hypothetical protein
MAICKTASTAMTMWEKVFALKVMVRTQLINTKYCKDPWLGKSELSQYHNGSPAKMAIMTSSLADICTISGQPALTSAIHVPLQVS